MLLRLNKYLSQRGRASRREADRLIVEGRVSVNGETVEDLGRKIDPEADRVVVDGKTVKTERAIVTVMLHKPAGCLVTRGDPEGRPTVMDLLPKPLASVFPVGRLDYNTEGLLLFTNDGELAYRLTHPKYEIRKRYAVQVTGEVTPAEARRLQKGVRLDRKKTAAARIRVFERAANRSILLVEVHEGRKREVRRMLESVGHRVQSLKRVEFAGLRLSELPYGKWRHLKKEEVRHLRKLVGLDRPERAAKPRTTGGGPL